VCFYVVLCVGRGLATGWSPVQWVLSIVCRIKILKRRPRPKKGPQSHNNNNNMKQADRSLPRGLRHKLSSPTQTLGSWVWIPLDVWMFAFILFCPV
jgi:hypothetical protein